MSATILLFHRVNPVRDVLWDPMSPQLFQQIISFVSSRYEVLSLEEICLNSPVTNKPKMAITFDDGFRDFAEYALPVLKKYHCHSSMFIVTDSADQNLPTWTYIMDYLFFHTYKLELPQADYGEDCRQYEVYKWPDKKSMLDYCKQFKQHLKKVDNVKRSGILSSFMAAFNDVDVPRNLMLNWDELKALDKNLVSLGSHTVSHPPLATIQSEEELQKEIKLSGDIMKQHLGYFPSAISYPVGSYDGRVKEASLKAGYKIGLAVDQKIYHSKKQDLFAVPRIELYNDSFLRSKLKIYGIESALKSLINK